MKVFIAFTTLLAVAFGSPSGYSLPLGYSGYPFAYSGLPLSHPGKIIAAPASLSSQFHSQDTLGQYSYGYSDGLSSKKEIKSLDGVTRGSYSYVDAKGKLQTVEYTADAIHGFRVAATNLPKPIKGAELSLPTPIREDAAVLREREIHLAAVEEAKIRNQTPIKAADLSAKLPKPVMDTPEVAKAKAEHLAAVKDAKIRNTFVKEIPVTYAPAAFSSYPLAHGFSGVPAVAPWSSYPAIAPWSTVSSVAPWSAAPAVAPWSSIPAVAPWSAEPIIKRDILRPYNYGVDRLHPSFIQLRDGRW